MGTERLFSWAHENPRHQHGALRHRPRPRGGGDARPTSSRSTRPSRWTCWARSSRERAGETEHGHGGQSTSSWARAEPRGAVHHRAALDGTRGAGLPDSRPAALGSARHHSRFVGGLHVTEWGVRPARKKRRRAARRCAGWPTRRSRRPRARRGYVLSLSISANTSASSGNRKVTWLSQTRLPSMSTKKTPPPLSASSGVMRTWS